MMRAFGQTGLEVSVLGFGAGHIGDPALEEQAVERLLGQVVDLGLTLIDTARSYGLSEARIGRHLRHRRGELVLSTKVGYGIEGVDDWTPEAVTLGIDEALVKMKTDWIDIVHLHSCPSETLARPGIIEALTQAVEAGKIRVAAYSGEGGALGDALSDGRFGAIQTSVNICDQKGLDTGVAQAAASGLGVIAKRPMANAPWRFDAAPEASDLAEYWRRFEAMGIDPQGMDWDALALRFSAFAPGVSTCIVGTHNLEHLRRNLDHVEQGPLEDDRVALIQTAFRADGSRWEGLI